MFLLKNDLEFNFQMVIGMDLLQHYVKIEFVRIGLYSFAVVPPPHPETTWLTALVHISIWFIYVVAPDTRYNLPFFSLPTNWITQNMGVLVFFFFFFDLPWFRLVLINLAMDWLLFLFFITGIIFLLLAITIIFAALPLEFHINVRVPTITVA